MESNFAKQISNFCHLDFSNSIANKPKALFCTKNDIQKPINFRKKTDKISLKCVTSGSRLTDYKNASKQYQQINQHHSYIQSFNPESFCHTTSQKQIPILQSPNKNVKRPTHIKSQIQIKLHQSLELQPQRMRQPQKNLMQQLRSYGQKRIVTSQKLERQNLFQTPKILIEKFSGNIVNSNTTCRNTVGSGQLSQRIQQKATQPLLVSTTKTNEPSKTIKKQNILEFKRYKDKQNPQSSTTIIQTRKQSLNSTQVQDKKSKLDENKVRVDKFRQLFGDFEIEDQIKRDLIAQKQSQEKKLQTSLPNIISMKQQSEYYPWVDEAQQLKTKQQNQTNNEPNKLTKAPINSKNLLTITKAQTFHVLQPSKQIQNHQHQQHRYKTEQKLKDFESIDSEESILYGQQFIDSLEFRSKCQLTENFKSIVSVHSQSLSQEQFQLADSIVINNHPKETLSSQPIRSLF